MSKQPTDFVGIISLSLSLTHVYAQPLLVCVYIVGYRWLLIVLFIYIVVCVHHQKRIASPSSILQHKVHRLRCVVGVEARDILMPAFLMVGIAIVNVRYVVAG